MRGKVTFTGFNQIYPRITPAHAGKSSELSMLYNDDGDHPRTCGEKERVILYTRGIMGSPPHMRGKVEYCETAENLKRITPAHAGKSSGGYTHANYKQDHPRTCGEKKSVGEIPHFCSGSPPHMRGKVGVIYTLRGIYRITPAHAGKSEKNG